MGWCYTEPLLSYVSEIPSVSTTVPPLLLRNVFLLTLHPACLLPVYGVQGVELEVSLTQLFCRKIRQYFGAHNDCQVYRYRYVERIIINKMAVEFVPSFEDQSRNPARSLEPKKKNKNKERKNSMKRQMNSEKDRRRIGGANENKRKSHGRERTKKIGRLGTKTGRMGGAESKERRKHEQTKKRGVRSQRQRYPLSKCVNITRTWHLTYKPKNPSWLRFSPRTN